MRFKLSQSIFKVCLKATLFFVFISTAEAHSSRDTRALTTVRAIQNSVNMFLDEYSVYPVRVASDGTSVFETAEGGGSELTAHLTGLAGDLNLKKIRFLTVKKSVGTKGSERDGLLYLSESTVNLLDPWGNSYYVVFDLDRDGLVQDPFPYGEKRMVKGVSCLVWSAGADGRYGSKEIDYDNVTSWEGGVSERPLFLKFWERGIEVSVRGIAITLIVVGLLCCLWAARWREKRARI